MRAVLLGGARCRASRGSIFSRALDAFVHGLVAAVVGDALWAETSHPLLSTLHTLDATETINRIV